MKKFLSLLLASALLIPVFTACKSNSENTKQTNGEVSPAADGPTSEIDPTAADEITTYQNPVMTANSDRAWSNYGFGDPFVMRYNGMYYLYVSTKDNNSGIKCWSSTDLINWTYEGLCCKEKMSIGAYAPEVYYYNGAFYMYTSPKGEGHYVLKSDSPTGPFTTITGNIGMSIDGSVFIDHDGKWYFYTAGGNSITVYDMSGPSQMSSGRAVNTLSVNNGWTEGPMVVYHDGYYYMTYTGNHVLSKSYRIYYGVGSRSPISFSGTQSENPLLINTSDEVYGIGHSSTVKGPDLDSYYIVYHSLINQTPNRNMNIDRIVFNGTSMEIMGPTVDQQQVPSMPDLYAFFNPGDNLDDWTLSGSLGSGTGLPLASNSTLISKDTLSGNYTAEYNITSIENGGRAGAVFSYTDEQNYGSIIFDPESQKIMIVLTVNGEASVKTVNMVQSFKQDVKFDCLQSLQVEKCGNRFTFYMNDHPLCTMESDLGGGAIGYITDGAGATFGFIGATGAVGGMGASDEYKSVSELNGLIPANTYTTGSYPTETLSGVDAVVATSGNVLNYRILAAADGNYDLAAEYFTGESHQDAKIEIYVDGNMIGDLSLPASKKFAAAIERGIPLTKGQHTLSFKLVEGNANFTEFTLLKGEEINGLQLEFDNSKDGNLYTDGAWKITGGVLSISGDPSTGKRLWGDRNWGDYTVEVDITPTNGINCGLLVRASNPGAPNFMESDPTADHAQTGTDWLEGYFVGLSENQVFVGKQSYDYDGLASESADIQIGNTYRLKVVCLGANLKVYVNDTLYIDYTDAEPFMQGMVGVRTHRCNCTFDNLTVSKVN